MRFHCFAVLLGLLPATEVHADELPDPVIRNLSRAQTLDSRRVPDSRRALRSGQARPRHSRTRRRRLASDPITRSAVPRTPTRCVDPGTTQSGTRATATRTRASKQRLAQRRSRVAPSRRRGSLTIPPTPNQRPVDSTPRKTLIASGRGST